MLLVIGVVFTVLLLFGMPVSFALGITAMAGMLYEGMPLYLLVRKMYAGIDIFVLMAVPLFILAANIMNESGITNRMMRLANLLVGRIRGGLAQANVLASVFFSGISGTALADAGGLAKIELKMMKDAGYDKEFSAALSASSAVVGPIIPPSIMMIIYSFIAGNVSIISLFVAGIVPGLLIGLSLMIIAYVISWKRSYPRREDKVPFAEIVETVRDGVVAIVMPLIIILGIRAGVFTPTEAAAAAVFYALLVGLFVTRELKVSRLPGILLESFILTAAIFLIIATASAVAYLLTVAHVASTIGDAIYGITNSPLMFLMLTMIAFLILGAIMEPTAAMIIALPIFAPLAGRYGIDPLHFAILTIVNLSIGCITPPVGTSLYAVAAVAELKVETLSRALIPFLIAEIAVLFLLVLFPWLTLVVPRMMGVPI